MSALLTVKQFEAYKNDPNGVPQQLAKMLRSAHELFLKAKPGYAEACRLGHPAPVSREDALDAFCEGKSGEEFTKAAKAFAAKYPTEASYRSAYNAYVASGKLTSLAALGSQTAKPAGPNLPPPPAISVCSDRLIDAMVKSAGAAFETAWLELVEKVSKGGYGDVSKEFTWTHGPRDYCAAVAYVSPYRGSYSTVRPMVRVACVDSERGENAKIVEATIGKMKGALENRDVIAADKAIRALGSPDGFDTHVDGI